MLLDLGPSRLGRMSEAWKVCAPERWERGHARQNAFFPGVARHAEKPM
jgi:hypothetical protein